MNAREPPSGRAERTGPPWDPWPRYKLFNFSVNALTLAQVLAAVRYAVRTHTRLSISYVNPNYAMSAMAQPDLAALMDRFDVMLPDGTGIVLAARLLGVPMPERLGTDYVAPFVFEILAECNGSLYLFGSAPNISERAARRVREAYPACRVVGWDHGHYEVLREHPDRFASQDSDSIVARINAANPDVLLVGLPTPMQQRWVADNRHRLTVPVIMTGGGYLDHLAVSVQWYPAWVDRLRLNWLFRLFQEPRRLWRRYSIELTAFALAVFKEWVYLKSRRSRGRHV